MFTLLHEPPQLSLLELYLFPREGRMPRQTAMVEHGVEELLDTDRTAPAQAGNTCGSCWWVEKGRRILSCSELIPVGCCQLPIFNALQP